MKFCVIFFLFVCISLNYLASSNGQSDSDNDANSAEMLREVTKMNKDESCFCQLGLSNRIVGGRAANLIPWQVSLEAVGGRFFCSGAIINHDYVLTAKHCLENYSKDEIVVRVGIHNLNDAGTSHFVEKIHSLEFDDFENAGDIAILKLDYPIDFGKIEVKPACFNLNDKTYSNNVMVSGWGSTQITKENTATGERIFGTLSPFLKQAYLYVYTTDCPDFNICVDSENGDSPCDGDSGGPLHYTVNGRTYVEGVLSNLERMFVKDNIRHSCVGKAAYSKLSYYEYKQWFESIIKDNYCS